MASEIKSIALERLIEHPDNANVQSKGTFSKLVRHIKRTGFYEPLVVRPLRERKGYYQVINGHHRLKAVQQLGYKECDCVVWEVDDEETEILLLTLNRIGGTDNLARKLRILKSLNERRGAKYLGRLLPQSAIQIERLVNLKKLNVLPNVSKKSFAKAVVFFVDDKQERIVEKAISEASKDLKGATRAVRRGAALVEMACHYIQCVKNAS
ncbi:MAG: ParB/RepB/Spo0J family partition protein [Planctomycetota bacterium]|jgi:ParB/RepB/Spo0J family partition protein